VVEDAVYGVHFLVEKWAVGGGMDVDDVDIAGNAADVDDSLDVAAGTHWVKYLSHCIYWVI
jgi:hypothetical protein